MPTQNADTSTESLQGNVVVRASVRLREDWIESLRLKCDVDRLLTEVALKQKCHGVEVVFDGGIWHLVGCVCGVNGAREELLQRKKDLENQRTEEDDPRTCSNTCRVQEDRSPVMLPERSKGNNDTCEEKLSGRGNGESYKATEAATDGDAGKCDVPLDNMSAVRTRRSAYGQEDTAKKKSSPKTNEAIQQRNCCWSFEQNPRGNSLCGGKGSKDSNGGTTERANKYTKIRDDEQTEVSKVKIDANKEKSAAAAAADDDDDVACSSATVWWTRKQNSAQLKQQENRPNASADERGFSDTESSSDEQRDRVFALRLLRSVAVDRQVYYFLFRKRSSELSAISRRCSVFESFDDDGCFRIAIEQGPDQDLDSIVSDLENLRLQVTEQVVPFPADVCFDGLEDSIKATTCCTDNVDLYFDNDAKICQMVGRQKDIDQVKNEISKLMDANKGERFNASSAGTAVKGHLNPTELPPPPPPCHPPAGFPVFTILSHDQCNMELLVNSGDPIALDLVCGDLIDACSADVLVTFVDHDLKPFGRFARSIASQFQPSLTKELASLGITGLPTGNLVHTVAQGLGAVQLLVHVVPPTEHEFPLTDPNTANVLQTVFTNCIFYSNDTLTAKSMCIPAVGCGTYPCSLVANCFVYALLQFHQSIITGRRILHLRRIQLVNKDTRQMAELIDAMHRRLSNM